MARECALTREVILDTDNVSQQEGGKTIHRTATLILAIIILSIEALGGELIATKSKDTISEDVPLTFELEKTTWEAGKLRIWGTVQNPGKEKYTYVQVVFTVRDATGKFIGRKSWFTDPKDIGHGQVGYIEDDFVECKGQKPTTVEFSVIGERSR